MIVYIMGGVTYSELRIAYEVSNDKKNWEVVIGECMVFRGKAGAFVNLNLK